MNLIFFHFHTDASGLKEPEHVRDSQEKVVQALQQYTTAQYPSIPSKFGELLLRMPELHRVCQVCKLFPGLITEAVFLNSLKVIIIKRFCIYFPGWKRNVMPSPIR